MFKGIAASSGIAIGKAYKYTNQKITVEKRRIQDCEIEMELDKFNSAVTEYRQQLCKIREKTEKELGKKEAEIFDAHLMILEDPLLKENVENKIKDDKNTAQKAVDSTTKEFVKIFKELDDEYLRERFADIEDVGKGIIKNILNIKDLSLENINEEIIIISEDLTPSDTARMPKDKVLGFALDTGGKTSHISIMANSLEIPAVVGAKGLSEYVNNNDIIIIDGNKGIVFVNPSEDKLRDYKEQLINCENEKKELEKLKMLPSRTTDGVEIEISANIGSPEDVQGAIKYGAEGIGLYRTEFLFMHRDDLPTEDEQFIAYKEVGEKMSSSPVIIRTLDIGADKQLSYLELPKELNPFLGWRAIRICLEKKEVFKTQLRAILRASHFGNLRIMYPMISRVEEIHEANEILEQAKHELRKEKVAFDENIEVGIMIETPSAAIISDILIKEVDFFSIGTNDLTQYTLAVDRMNEKVSELYTPLHPAILRIIKYVIDASHEANKWTGMCGELAGDPAATTILIGLGIDELSMSSKSIPKVKKVIRNISYSTAKELADKALGFKTTKEIEELCQEILLTIDFI